jgi:Protein of unknown function (DUF3102)
MNTPAASELNALAAKVRASVRAAQVAACNALHAALDAGDALVTAQEQVPAGEWTRWLRHNCFLSKRTALLYMQLARHRDEIEARLEEIPDLSLRAARRLIMKRVVQEEEEEESGEEEVAPVVIDHKARLQADWRAAPNDAREAFLVEILTELGLRPVLEAMSGEQQSALERRAFGSLKSRTKTRKERATLDRLHKRRPYLELEANPTSN